MADETVRALLAIEPERQSFAKSEQALTKLESAAAGVAKALRADFGANAKAAGKDVDRLGDYSDAAAKKVDRLRQRLDDSAKAAKRLSQSSAAASAPSKRGFDIGRSEMALMGVSQLLGGAGGGLGAGLMFGADIIGAVDAMGMMRAEMAQVGGAAGVLSSVLGPLAIGAAAVSGAVVLANEAYKESRQATQVAIDSLKLYYAALRDMTSQQAAEALEKANDDLEAALAYRDALRQQEAAAWERESGIALGDFGARIRTLLGASATGVEDYGAAMDTANQAVLQAQAAVDAYTRVLDESALAANDAAAAERARTQEVIAGAEAAARTEMERARLMRTATVEGTRDAITESREYIRVLEEQVQALKDSGVWNQEIGDEMNRLIDLYEKEKAEVVFLQEVILPLAEAREKEARAADALQKTLEANLRRTEQLAGAMTKYDTDVARIEEASLAQRAAIQKAYNDRLVEIAADAAAAAADALAKLQERRAELAEDFARGEADAARQLQREDLERQIAFQREEARAYRDHAQNLEDIRRAAQDREADLIAARDFAGLYRSRRDTTRQLEEANRNFVRERKERQEEYKLERADAARHAEEQRRERLRQYQQALADAQAAYYKERAQIEQQRREALAQAAADHARALAEEATARRQALDARRKGLIDEINLINQTEAAKAEIIATQSARALAALSGLWEGTAAALARAALRISMPAQATPGTFSTYGGSRRQAGGPLAAGEWALVNEGAGQRETFTAGGRTAQFPPGMGLFFPTQAGVVNAGRGASISIGPFNIDGAQSPQLTADAVQRIVVRTMDHYFN